MWFPVTPSDLTFCDRSPHRIVTEAVLPVSPTRAFELLTGDRELGTWLQDFVACRWTSDPPHGVGSTREVSLKILSVKEKFLAWAPGERVTFTFTAANLPLLRRAVEDFRLTALGPEETGLRWTVHYELPGVLSPFDAVLRAVFVRLFSRSLENLGRVARG